MAHLMKFYLLQWEVMEEKFLINANMTLTVLNLHQTILKVKVIMTSSKVKLRSHHGNTHL